MYDSTKQSLQTCVKKIEFVLGIKRGSKTPVIPEYIQKVISNTTSFLYKLSAFADDEEIEASFNVIPDVDGTIDVEIHYNGKTISFAIGKDPARLEVTYFDKDRVFEETIALADVSKCVNWLLEKS